MTETILTILTGLLTLTAMVLGYCCITNKNEDDGDGEV